MIEFQTHLDRDWRRKAAGGEGLGEKRWQPVMQMVFVCWFALQLLALLAMQCHEWSENA